MTVLLAIDEALASLRAGKSAAVSVGTIAIAFVTLGGFLLVSVNIRTCSTVGSRPRRFRST